MGNKRKKLKVRISQLETTVTELRALETEVTELRRRTTHLESRIAQLVPAWRNPSPPYRPWWQNPTITYGGHIQDHTTTNIRRLIHDLIDKPDTPHHHQ